MPMAMPMRMRGRSSVCRFFVSRDLCVYSVHTTRTARRRGIHRYPSRTRVREVIGRTLGWVEYDVARPRGCLFLHL